MSATPERYISVPRDDVMAGQPPITRRDPPFGTAQDVASADWPCARDRAWSGAQRQREPRPGAVLGGRHPRWPPRTPGGARRTNRIFISGFITNTLVAVALTFVGDRLGIDLYLVALFAFGLRIFQNVALIRRHFL